MRMQPPLSELKAPSGSGRLPFVVIASLLLTWVGAGFAIAQGATPSDDPGRPPGLTQNPTRPSSWTDAEGRSYTRSVVGTWTNYDEAKANPFPLPDPLVLKNGQPVTDADTWWKQRRPELIEAFRSQMYGRIPENTPKITWETGTPDPSAAGGTAIKRTVMGHIDNARYPAANPSIHLTLFTPTSANGRPVPKMVIVIAGPGGYGAPRPGPVAPPPDPPPGLFAIRPTPPQPAQVKPEGRDATE